MSVLCSLDEIPRVFIYLGYKDNLPIRSTRMFSIGWSLVTGLIEVLTINQNPAPCIFQSKQIYKRVHWH